MTRLTGENQTGNGFDELRMFAKAVGFLAVLTALLYLRAIAGGGFMEGAMRETGMSATMMFVLLAVATVGLVLAWRWEGIGGALAVVAAIAVAVAAYLSFETNQLLAILVYSSPFIISGGLYLADWWKHREA